MVQIQRFLDFLKAYKDLFQMVCLNLKIGIGHNFPFSKNNHGLYIYMYIAWYLSKTGRIRLLILTHHLKRPLSKHSENHKINVIGPTKLKLWLFKDALLIVALYGLFRFIPFKDYHNKRWEGLT